MHTQLSLNMYQVQDQVLLGQRHKKTGEFYMQQRTMELIQIYQKLD